MIDYLSIKGSGAINKGCKNFYECCDLTKKKSDLLFSFFHNFVDEVREECHDETVTELVTETIMQQECTNENREECHDETVTELITEIVMQEQCTGKLISVSGIKRKLCHITHTYFRYTFLSNHNVHKSFCGLYFQAPYPLIDRLSIN